jgi:hypothetical protein
MQRLVSSRRDNKAQIYLKNGVGSAVPVGFNPLSTSPSMWLDASEADTFTEVSSAISEWRDRSGNARHVAQSNSALRPVRQANILNSRHGVYLGGSTWLANAAAYNIRSIVMLAKWEDTTGDWRSIVGGALSGPDANWSGNSAPGNPMFGPFSSAEVRSGTGHINGTSTSPSAWTRYTTNTIHAITTHLSQLSIMVWGGDRPVEFATRPFKGWYYEILTYNIAISTDNRQLVEGYLAHKWGVTASLPSDHPYKTFAPMA